MMTFVETPWPAVLTCTVALVVFGVLFMRTGRASMIVAMAAIVGALVGLVVLEQTIVTDTEEVQDTLHGIAEHLAANNVTEVLASFAPNCRGLAQARPVLSRVTVESATIGRDLEVRISKLTSPASATAFFNSRLSAEAFASSGRVLSAASCRCSNSVLVRMSPFTLTSTCSTICAVAGAETRMANRGTASARRRLIMGNP